jgi:hypothetical protein
MFVVPERVRGPAHCPFAGLADAVQEVAFVEDQASCVEPPLTTAVGVAERETVGTAGGGGKTVTESEADSPAFQRF